MKKYYKILATAWMAIRPLFPCFAANTNKIQWGTISNYFNFSTITEEEKCTNLETNIRLLIEEQLKLRSGQNLWKAFQFWEEQHQGLSFQFEFSLTSNSSASVVLKNTKKSPDGKQVFCFEIAINSVFAEFDGNYFTDTDDLENLLKMNMLYRPCLIKLVDPDDPDNWHYHLREQKLPFFITLAHEFLHALNQLERIDQYWDLDLADEYDQNGDILTILKSKISMQDFLANKLNLKNGIGILDDKYLNFWGNEENDDFLDEMTVILGNERKIEDDDFVFIGETTFLMEFYKDNTIISWSHFSAKDINFWKNMSIILREKYVQTILEKFDLLKMSLLKVNPKHSLKKFFYQFYNTTRSARNKERINVQKFFELHKNNLDTIFVHFNIEKVNKEFYIQRKINLNNKIIRLLPKYIEVNSIE